jgi:hypothetical protein
MRIHELLQKYDFHDSLIESIGIDEKNNQITMLIFLCNWLQKGYAENQPENIRIKLVFKNVSDLSKEESGNRQFSDEIVDVQHIRLEGGRSRLKFLVTTWNDIRSITFETDGVELTLV